MDVQEIPRGFGMGEEFPEEGVVGGVGVIWHARKMAGSPGDVNIILSGVGVCGGAPGA
jgi:hypothetical protein